MASGTQLGATHARVTYNDCGPNHSMAGWTGDAVLPVVDESFGRDAHVWIGSQPFVSHVIVADHFGDAYEAYIDAVADSIMIDDETLKDYIVGHDSDGNPEFTEVEWTSGGEAVDTTYVSLTPVPLSALTWLYRGED